MERKHTPAKPKIGNELIRFKRKGKSIWLICIKKRITQVLLNISVRNLHCDFQPVRMYDSINYHGYIYSLSGKQCGSWADGFFMKQLFWIYTVLKVIFLCLAGQELNSIHKQRSHQSVASDMCPHCLPMLPKLETRLIWGMYLLPLPLSQVLEIVWAIHKANHHPHLLGS